MKKQNKKIEPKKEKPAAKKLTKKDLNKVVGGGHGW